MVSLFCFLPEMSPGRVTKFALLAEQTIKKRAGWVEVHASNESGLSTKKHYRPHLDANKGSFLSFFGTLSFLKTVGAILRGSLPSEKGLKRGMRNHTQEGIRWYPHAS